MKMKDKNSKEFWERHWRELRFARYIPIRRWMAVNKKFDKLFKSTLKKGKKRILEIGCANGNWLVYFAKEFGYEPYGVDYSEVGCKVAMKNLKLANVKGVILCEDIFQTSLKDEYFDIVYSMGLIEHFENPTKIIDKHLELLKKGGILIIEMPSLNNSIYSTLAKISDRGKTSLKIHNTSVMDKTKLTDFLKGKAQVMMVDYFGPLDLSLLFGLLNIRNKVLLLLMQIINQIIGYFTFYLKPSKYFSPYLVLIAEKMA